MSPLRLKHDALTFSAFEHGAGPLVLCLHGFPDSPRTFRHQVDDLVAAGYRVVTPTLRGYEPSSQPKDGNYRAQVVADDVIAWLDQLGVERCHLVGHDWGAIVSYMVAAKAPERLHSLTTLAIPHLNGMLDTAPIKRPIQLVLSWYILFFQLRGIAEYVLERNDWALVDRLWRNWSPGFVLPQEELAAIKRQLAQPGVKKAVLAYYRALPLIWFERASAKLLARPIEVRTLALTGALDGCMDTRLFDDLMRPRKYPAGLRIERLADAGHFLHQERPAEINRLLINHFDASNTHDESGLITSLG